MKSIAVFSNNGRVGATSLVYHLAWMYAKLDYNVLVADLDPQANLTAMFLRDDEVEALWKASDTTIHASLQPPLAGTGDVTMPKLVEPTSGLSLLAGDMRLANAEDELSDQWADSLAGKERALRVLSAIWHGLRLAAHQVQADVVLVDVGHDLGALNRAAMVAVDHVVLPVAPDLYSLQGLRNVGPTLRKWRREWRERRRRGQVADAAVPHGAMNPIGYVVLQHAVRLDRPAPAYGRWMAAIPDAYRRYVLDIDVAATARTVRDDEHCLAALSPYRILMPLAREARKPMFYLKPADGALGGHTRAVADCYRDFKYLALEIARRCNVPEPGI